MSMMPLPPDACSLIFYPTASTIEIIETMHLGSLTGVKQTSPKLKIFS
jgi:hypothetical protein